jgi:hypothetical protein
VNKRYIAQRQSPEAKPDLEAGVQMHPALPHLPNPIYSTTPMSSYIIDGQFYWDRHINRTCEGEDPSGDNRGRKWRKWDVSEDRFLHPY